MKKTTDIFLISMKFLCKKNTVSAVGARLLLWLQQQNLLDVSRDW